METIATYTSKIRTQSSLKKIRRETHCTVCNVRRACASHYGVFAHNTCSLTTINLRNSTLPHTPQTT